MRRGFLSFLFIISCSLLVAASESTVSITGRLRGKVLDESTQKPLPFVNIMVEGSQLGTASDEQGEYVIESIPSGIQQVRFMMMGYEDRLINNVVVNPNKTTWQKIELTPTVLEGQGVTVTAGYFHEAKDAIVSNKSVDYEELRSDPGSVMDIQRVVQALPAVVSGSDQMNEIIVRGGMPGENLFVMDHIEIPNPNHFGDQGGGGGPINMLNAQMVRRVDFYAGAFPARYGDKASSVLDISLRDGDREKFTGHLYMGMSGAGGIVEGPFANGKGSYILSAQKSFLDLIISSVGLTAVPRYYSFQGKVIYDLDKNNQLRLNGIYGNDDITIEDDEDTYSQGADNVHAQSHQYAFGATWKRLWSEGFSRVTLSNTLNHWNTDVYHNSGTSYYRNLSTEAERTLKADITWMPGPNTELSAGGHVKSIPFNLYQWSDEDTLWIYDTRYNPSRYIGDSLYYEPYLQDMEKTTLKAAAFTQVKWNMFPRLSTSLGVRIDYFDYTGKSTIDPRIGFSYTLTPVTHFNVAFGQHSQSPAYVQVAAHPLNKDLDYKKTRQVVVGFDHLFMEDMRGTFEVYYKDYRDVPIGIGGLTDDPFDASYGRAVNEGKGYAKGVELFLQKKRSRHLNYTFSYSYSVSKGLDPRYNVYYNWDYDYRHVFTFVGGFHYDFRKKDWYQKLNKNFFYNMISWALPIADQLEIGIRWRYLGGRPYTERTYLPRYRVWSVPPGSLYNTERYPEYHRLDLRIDRRYMFSTWNMVVFFDIMNIYGRDNIWDYSYNSDGTREQILQWSTMPVGGVTIEF